MTHHARGWGWGSRTKHGSRVIIIIIIGTSGKGRWRSKPAIKKDISFLCAHTLPGCIWRGDFVYVCVCVYAKNGLIYPLLYRLVGTQRPHNDSFRTPVVRYSSFSCTTQLYNMVVVGITVVVQNETQSGCSQSVTHCRDCDMVWQRVKSYTYFRAHRKGKKDQATTTTTTLTFK